MNKESIYNKEYYQKNKNHIDARITRRMQCARCLRVVQYRGMKAHVLTPKCERDYQKRLNPVDPKPVKKKKEKGEIVGTFNEPDGDV